MKFTGIFYLYYMCYSTSLRKNQERIESILGKKLYSKFASPNEFEPYFHLNGFTHGNLYIITMDQPRLILPAMWGLVPHWASENPEGFWKKSNTLNARGEEIFDKNSFRDSARDRRCLILADGFFEPHHENGVPIPYFCYQPSTEFSDGQLFLFAGLYTELDDGQLTTSILTVDANPLFAEVHNKGLRMPLVLDENLYQDWLDDLNEPSVNEIIATGFTSQPFRAHPVSRDLYKKNIDTNQPYIVEEVEKGTLF